MLTIVTSVMYGVYIMCYYIWNIGYFLGHLLCQLLISLIKIGDQVCTIIRFLKEDLYYFLVDLDQGSIYIGDVIYSIISRIGYSVLKVIAGLFQQMHNFISSSGQRTKLLLKCLIISICEFLNMIRDAVILIGQTISWSVIFIPRLIWYTITSVIGSAMDVITYLKETIFFEITTMATDKNFLISVIIIMLFVSLSWSQRQLFGYLALKILNLFKLHLKRAENVKRMEDISTICVVCLELPKSILLLPCAHFCLCLQCAEVINCNYPKNCPLCRKEIKSTMLVYV